jgi:hypothetical protein
MGATEFVRFVGHYAHMIQFDGTNANEVTEFLNTDRWSPDAEGREAKPNDWLYLDAQNKPAILSNRRKRLETTNASSPRQTGQ